MGNLRPLWAVAVLGMLIVVVSGFYGVWPAVVAGALLAGGAAWMALAMRPG